MGLYDAKGSIMLEQNVNGNPSVIEHLANNEDHLFYPTGSMFFGYESLIHSDYDFMALQENNYGKSVVSFLLALGFKEVVDYASSKLYRYKDPVIGCQIDVQVFDKRHLVAHLGVRNYLMKSSFLEDFYSHRKPIRAIIWTWLLRKELESL
jgi:hypothetical protein